MLETGHELLGKLFNGIVLGVSVLLLFIVGAYFTKLNFDIKYNQCMEKVNNPNICFVYASGK